MNDPHPHPILRQTVLDTTDARGLAGFYRRFLGLRYRVGDEPPADDGDDRQAREWLALRDVSGLPVLAFQPVASLPPVTWPDGEHPQMLHLDLTVPTVDDLWRQHERAAALGARHLLDRSGDAHEPLHVYADPAGHPFCVFVAPGGPDDGH
ncbi:VOC family protein [Actinomycetospora sp. C-140]